MGEGRGSQEENKGSPEPAFLTLRHLAKNLHAWPLQVIDETHSVLSSWWHQSPLKGWDLLVTPHPLKALHTFSSRLSLCSPSFPSTAPLELKSTVSRLPWTLKFHMNETCTS